MISPLLRLLCFALVTTQICALLPKPKSFTNGSSLIILSANFEITFDGFTAPDDLQSAAKRIQESMIADSIEPLVVGRGNSVADDVEAASKRPQLERLKLTLNQSRDPQAAPSPNKTVSANNTLSIAECAVLPLTEREETYSLAISGANVATMEATTALGLYRGLTTFAQLVYKSGEKHYIPSLPLLIDDAPAFPHRSLMLDTARNFFPVKKIQSLLDSMSYAKLNVFHWHITDSQSWPLEIVSIPDLAKNGAYSQDEIYTQAQIKDLTKYANERGIDVLVEVDMPSHTGSIGETFPNLTACYTKDWADLAAEPPAGQITLLDGGKELAKKILKDVMPTIQSSYFITGGDETNFACYENDTAIAEHLKSSNSTIPSLIQSFVTDVHATVRESKKTPVVWQEVVAKYNVTLANTTLVEVWEGPETVRSVIELGYSIIHANPEHFYLDCGHGAWLGNAPDANSWCDPYKTWQKIRSFDPFEGLEEDQQKFVLGGDVLLWTEQSGPENMDQMIWPRAAAAAEVFWSHGEADMKEVLPRMHDFRYRLVQQGVGATPLQPHWCALRPGKCDA